MICAPQSVQTGISCFFMGVELFLGSLAWETTSSSIARHLWRWIPPEATTVVCDRESGRSKGFGLALVATPEDAMIACRANGSYLDGRPVMIRVSRSPRRLTRPSHSNAAALDQARDACSVAVTAEELQEVLLKALKGNDSADIWTRQSLARFVESGASIDTSSVRGSMRQMVELLAERPELLVELHPRLFEHLIGALLSHSGYQEVRVSVPSADGGIDIYATRSTALGRLLFVLQCKRYSPKRKVSRPQVQLTYGVLAASDATAGCVVTTSTFSKPARDFLKEKQHQIGGIDFDDLGVWLQATAQTLSF